MKAELEQLIALQDTDTGIRRLQAALNAIPQRRADIEKDFEQRAFEFKEVEKRRDEALAKRSQLERELAETRTHAEKAERDLMSSTNEKSYTAAIREVDAAKKHISTLETGILEQMEIIEQTEKDMAEREPEVSKLRAERDEKLKVFEEQTARETQDLERLRAERARLMATLPKQMSALYDRISQRIPGGVAVAEARNNSCTACFMALRPQVMTQIRRGDEIIICDNCNRILYYVPAEQQHNSTTVSAS